MYEHGFLFLPFLRTARRSVLRTGGLCCARCTRFLRCLWSSVHLLYRLFCLIFRRFPFRSPSTSCVFLLVCGTQRQHRRRRGARTAAAPTLRPLPNTQKLRKAPHFWKGGMSSRLLQHPRACHSQAAALLSSPLHTVVDRSPFWHHCHTLDSSTPLPAFSVSSFVAPRLR